MRYLVTGGAGFIGANYVDRLLSRGVPVRIYDNLSRPGVRANLEWLVAAHGASADIEIGDVCDHERLAHAVRDVDVIAHLAGQTALTTSIVDPMADFRANALGSLGVLEAARRSPRHPIVLYASTNKVYGRLDDMPVVEQETRYAFRDLPFGIDEQRRVEFCGPYGCSKGTGDQYTLDYARTFGLRTVVFRQSCVYGPRQMGTTDQGWLAWFMTAVLAGDPITVYGDGKQARDALYVDDVLDAYDAAVHHIDQAAGQVYNIGGGPGNVLSVWKEFGPVLERLSGHHPEPRYAAWRPADQRVYVSDIRKAQRDLDWEPKVSLGDGLEQLFTWIARSREWVTRAAGA